MSHLANMQEVTEILKSCGRKTLSPIEIHGLLTAAVCGPETISPTRWLAYIFPKTKSLKTIVSKSWFARVTEFLVETYEDILFSIRAGTFTPYLADKKEDSERLEAAKDWCTGFLYGMHLHGVRWSESSDETLATLTAPIFYLADPDIASEELDKEEQDKLRSKAPLLIELLRVNPSKIFDHWNMGKKPELKKDFFNESEGNDT